MHKIILSFAVVAGLLGLACNQQPKTVTEGLREPRADTAADQQTGPPQVAMTGCLRKGSTPDTFLLVDDVGLPKTQVEERTPSLASYVGHKIQVTGTSTGGSQGRSMKPTSVKEIAASCP
jgi:hypothetical protein